MGTSSRLTLLYDGECPICRREIAWLKRRDRHGQLLLENIAAEHFDPSAYNLSREEVGRVLHGVLPDGSVVEGMDAVRAAYRSVGLGWVMAPTKLPGIRAVTDFLYRSFARNRLVLGGIFRQTCLDGHCHRKELDANGDRR